VPINKPSFSLEVDEIFSSWDQQICLAVAAELKSALVVGQVFDLGRADGFVGCCW